MISRVLLAAGCAALACSPAMARPLATGGVTAQEVASVLQDAGYSATIGKDSAGDPQIKSAAEGVEYYVNFYSCETGRCKSIEFSAGFDMTSGTTLDHANDWNKRFRFGKVHLDSDDDPYMKMDIDVEDGLTTEFLKSNLLRWVSVVDDFKEHIDW